MDRSQLNIATKRHSCSFSFYQIFFSPNSLSSPNSSEFFVRTNINLSAILIFDPISSNFIPLSCARINRDSNNSCATARAKFAPLSESAETLDRKVITSRILVTEIPEIAGSTFSALHRLELTGQPRWGFCNPNLQLGKITFSATVIAKVIKHDARDAWVVYGNRSKTRFLIRNLQDENV